MVSSCCEIVAIDLLDELLPYGLLWESMRLKVQVFDQSRLNEVFNVWHLGIDSLWNDPVDDMAWVEHRVLHDTLEELVSCVGVNSISIEDVVERSVSFQVFKDG